MKHLEDNIKDITTLHIHPVEKNYFKQSYVRRCHRNSISTTPQNILSPILKGLLAIIIKPTTAILIVFIEAKPITIPPATANKLKTQKPQTISKGELNMKLEESEINDLKEKLKKLGLNEEEALNIIKATLLILSKREFAEREETQHITKLMKKYGIKPPF